MSSSDPGTIREAPPRQMAMLDGNEQPIYDLLMQPWQEPGATDETQMLNLNQVDALNIPIPTIIIIDDVNVNVAAQVRADKNAGIPDVVVRNTEESQEDDSIGT